MLHRHYKSMSSEGFGWLYSVAIYLLSDGSNGTSWKDPVHTLRTAMTSEAKHIDCLQVCNDLLARGIEVLRGLAQGRPNAELQ